jgi:hypothetical protein
MKRFLMGSVVVLLGFLSHASEFSITVAPTAQLRYKGEGKLLPQGYVNRFEGNLAPLYRLEWRQTPDPKGFWGLGLWHTGIFGGGTFGQESIPDGTGTDYQVNQMNVGFTNLFVTYHRPLVDMPVEVQVHLSVVREIFKRKEFVVNGAPVSEGFDDVNEISAEGIGFGLAGTHGQRFFFRWQTAVHYYVQLFDAKTDASAGSIFQGEGGVGWRMTPALALEVGGLWQDWFILGQGNRRLHVDGTEGAVISYNRQQTTLQGLYLRVETRFGSNTPSN